MELNIRHDWIAMRTRLLERDQYMILNALTTPWPGGGQQRMNAPLLPTKVSTRDQ